MLPASFYSSFVVEITLVRLSRTVSSPAKAISSPILTHRLSRKSSIMKKGRMNWYDCRQRIDEVQQLLWVEPVTCTRRNSMVVMTRSFQWVNASVPCLLKPEWWLQLKQECGCGLSVHLMALSTYCRHVLQFSVLFPSSDEPAAQRTFPSIVRGASTVTMLYPVAKRWYYSTAETLTLHISCTITPCLMLVPVKFLLESAGHASQVKFWQPVCPSATLLSVSLISDLILFVTCAHLSMKVLEPKDVCRISKLYGFCFFDFVVFT